MWRYVDPLQLQDLNKFITPALPTHRLSFHRALILYVAAGALPEALETLRKNQRPDIAALFLLACHEIYSQITTESESSDDTPGSGSPTSEQSPKLRFPSKNVDDEDLIAVSEVFGHYQQKLIHVCMDAEPNVDWALLAPCHAICQLPCGREALSWMDNIRSWKRPSAPTGLYYSL